ncbi:acyltransferase family protein [Azospirillum griseum]|uniref:Acyltransferase 3 domain-containing protein n=1 Tax=Azospirillum griseum TaxID=2496639 RepID=A0A431VBC2_9PROT|nr:acyltransferase family protein [Azospirillum griseum]RTR15072.1 hypothetical protein EJ903_23160 [Azospirillum griseum]
MTATARWHYLDALRVFGILSVFLFHNNHFFDDLPWHVKSPDHHFIATLITVYMNYWIMPLFFLLAGAGTALALRKRSFGDYTRERFTRLLIPFLLCAPVLIPPQRYWEAIQFSGHTGGYLAFLADYFPRVWLDTAMMRSPFWFGAVGTHLWFLGVLFLISLSSIPVFALLRRPAWSGALRRFSDRPWGLWWIVLPALPLVVQRALGRPLDPGYIGWADFVFWGLIFLYGAGLTADPRFAERAVRVRWWAAAWTLIVFPAAGFFAEHAGFDHYIYRPDLGWDSLLFHAVWGTVTWAALVAIVGFAKRHLDAPSPRTAALAEGVMPFYILHQTIILALGFQMLDWTAPALLRFVVLTGSSLALSLACVAVAVRSPVLRFAMGMRPLPSRS